MVTAPPARFLTSCRAHSLLNGSLASESSPTSWAMRGSSAAGPIEARKLAIIPPMALRQSGCRSRSAGSRNIERSRFSPGRMDGDNAVARGLAASTSNIRLSTNAGRLTTAMSCRMPAGTVSCRGRLAAGRAGLAAARLSR